MPTINWAFCQTHPRYQRRSRNPTSEWYLQDTRGRSLLAPHHHVRRHAPMYEPWQSIGDTSGRFAYPGRRQYPYLDPYRGGYETEEQWQLRRPQYHPQHRTVHLGVIGMTDQPGYSWRWFNNARQGRAGRSYYDPPDRERSTPPREPATHCFRPGVYRFTDQSDYTWTINRRAERSYPAGVPRTANLLPLPPRRRV